MRIPEAKQNEVLSLKKSGASVTEIARRLKLPRSTVYSLLDRKEERISSEINAPVDTRGEDSGQTQIVTPDKPLTVAEMAKMFGIDLKVWRPIAVKTNQWQGFHRVKTEEGHRKVALFQTTISWERIVKKSLHGAIENLLKDLVTPVPPIKSAVPEADTLVVWGIWDAHIGMYAWSDEVGNSYDLQRATNRVLNSIDDVAITLKGRSPKKILIPLGNDLMHFDGAKHTTTRGDHFLDTDTRYQKVYESCLLAMCYMVEKALELCPDVEVLYVPGNHDQITGYTLCMAIKQRYRNQKGLKVDLSANPRKYRRFGGTLLGFDHGAGANAKQLAQIMASECAADWSKSTYREVQIGHTHQRAETQFNNLVPTNGVVVRVNPSLSGVDDWHHRQGFIGEPMKSVEVYTYSKVGFIGSNVAWARDDKSKSKTSDPI